MADRPILMSAPMVRATIAETKTQTRRMLSPDNVRFMRGGVNEPIVKYRPDANMLADALAGARNMRFIEHVLTWDCPDGAYVMANLKYEVGDRLWVKETFATTGGGPIRYAATDDIHELRIKKPSIFMPRSASRLTLEVTNVRVERLQEISKEDVIAEGITEREGVPIADVVCGWHEPYAQLWDTINGTGAWEANPFVVAISFKAHKCNIDRMQEAA